MLCAHTVRRLKPGAFDRFVDAVIANGVHEIAATVTPHGAAAR
jgi:hypothetical protein